MKVITIDEYTGKRVYSRKEVATLCGVSTQTIRIWEDAKTIPSSTRDDSGYRYWDEDALLKIKEFADLPRKERFKK